MSLRKAHFGFVYFVGLYEHFTKQNQETLKVFKDSVGYCVMFYPLYLYKNSRIRGGVDLSFE